MDKYTCLVEVKVAADDKLKAAHLLESILDDSSLCDVRKITVCGDYLDIFFSPKEMKGYD